MNIKSILLTAALLIAFAVTSQAQYTTMRVLEFSGDINSEIQIVYENGNSETIELKDYNYGRKFDENGEVSLQNMIKTNEVINKLKKDGYKLINFTNSGNQEGGNLSIIQIYIFEKED